MTHEEKLINLGFVKENENLFRRNDQWLMIQIVTIEDDSIQYFIVSNKTEHYLSFDEAINALISRSYVIYNDDHKIVIQRCYSNNKICYNVTKTTRKEIPIDPDFEQMCNELFECNGINKSLEGIVSDKVYDLS